MIDTADKIDEANGDYTDGHSPLHGHGRINANGAIETASGEAAQPTARKLSMEHRINRRIPDLGETETGITFPLAVTFEAMEVSVEIRHSWRGDLRLTLIPPRGRKKIVLVDRTGRGQDDLVRSFRSNDGQADFDSLLRGSAKGEWRLKVEDLARQDVGVLVKWGLAVTYRRENEQ